MTLAFNPVEELRRHGLCGDELSPEIEQFINTLTEDQVGAVVKVKEDIDLLSAPEVQAHSAADGSLALVRVMKWDSPAVEQQDGEVEGMGASGGPKEEQCLCVCSGAGTGCGAG